MKSRTRIMEGLISFLVVLFVAAATAYAAPIRVDCNRGGSISSTLASLASAGNTRDVTIFVTGTCRENIVITAFDHLALQASPIATLQDASGGTAPVVVMHASYDVTLQGFTVKGGSDGVVCDQVSYCTLYFNIIQQSGRDGVIFYHSHGRVISNNISRNAQAGVDALNGSAVEIISNTVNGNGYVGIASGGGSFVNTLSNTVSGNDDSGMVVASGSSVQAQNDTIQNNARFGIWVLKGAVLRAFDLTITGNNSDGVNLSQASSAAVEQDVTGNVITGNGGNGVSIGDLSFAEFDGTNNVSGNLTQPDVACNPQYSVSEGAGTVGGTTNCSASPNNRQRHLQPPIGNELLDRH